MRSGATLDRLPPPTECTSLLKVGVTVTPTSKGFHEDRAGESSYRAYWHKNVCSGLAALWFPKENVHQRIQAPASSVIGWRLCEVLRSKAEVGAVLLGPEIPGPAA